MLGTLPRQTKPKKQKDPTTIVFSSDSQPWQHTGITRELKILMPGFHVFQRL